MDETGNPGLNLVRHDPASKLIFRCEILDQEIGTFTQRKKAVEALLRVKVERAATLIGVAEQERKGALG
jgi:hypothetical protein